MNHDDRLDDDLDPALVDAIRRLPGTGGPPVEAARAAIRARRRTVWHAPAALASGLLAAALAMIATLPTASAPTRDKGLGGSGLEVHLEAVAEGPSGSRALGPADVVGPDERVVFRAAVRGDGYLRLQGDGATIWPSAGSTWAASTGAHAVGGDEPASYRPEQSDTVGAYVIWFCPTPEGEAGCVSDRFELRWGG